MKSPRADAFLPRKSSHACFAGPVPVWSFSAIVLRPHCSKTAFHRIFSFSLSRSKEHHVVYGVEEVEPKGVGPKPSATLIELQAEKVADKLRILDAVFSWPAGSKR